VLRKKNRKKNDSWTRNTYITKFNCIFLRNEKIIIDLH